MVQEVNTSMNKLSGEVSRIVYSNPENTYCVFTIIDDNHQEHTVRGNLSGISIGEFIEVCGNWEEHAEYGRQLKIEHFKVSLPQSTAGIKRYLASGIIPGIGEKIADRIVEHFGEKTLDVLTNYSPRLKEIPHLGPKKIKAIKTAWHEQQQRREMFIFLQGLGISPAYCRKLFNIYGENSALKVKSNPYQLANDVDGIGFMKADAIGKSLGLSPDGSDRIEGGIVYLIEQLTTAGNCCYPRDEFIRLLCELLSLDISIVEPTLDKAIFEKLIVEENAMIYPLNLYKAECALPQELWRILNHSTHTGSKLSQVPPLPDTKFSDQQLRAVDQVCQEPISIITGGPGVGKTTVISEIVRRAQKCGLQIALAAPTGRAAKRMAEATGFSASTIHRLLVYDPVKKGFQYNEHQRLNADIFIVDEVSMLDINLAWSFFKAVKNSATIVLVGDEDQLPSVGPGTVLSSMIESKLFGVTHLNKIFRQGAGSKIIVNAHLVNEGHLPELQPNNNTKALSDFYWIEQEDAERTVDIIGRLCKERIPRTFGLDPNNDIQILTPMNRGVCGTISLNTYMQELLNGGEKPQFKMGERTFKSGDKVMQICNNYDKNVFNGDLGRIGRIEYAQKKFVVWFDDGKVVEYNFDDAAELTLSYAITVHKAQGCEFKAVIFPILNQHYMMLQRNLLYTAMTRAKKLLILIGNTKALRMALDNVRTEPRFNQLLERLIQKCRCSCEVKQ